MTCRGTCICKIVLEDLQLLDPVDLCMDFAHSSSGGLKAGLLYLSIGSELASLVVPQARIIVTVLQAVEKGK